MDILTAREAADLIGITVARVYQIPDLYPVRPGPPYLYDRADVERIAAEYQPVGRGGYQKRRATKEETEV